MTACQLIQFDDIVWPNTSKVHHFWEVEITTIVYRTFVGKNIK